LKTIVCIKRGKRKRELHERTLRAKREFKVQSEPSVYRANLLCNSVKERVTALNQSPQNELCKQINLYQNKMRLHKAHKRMPETVFVNMSAIFVSLLSLVTRIVPAAAASLTR